MSTESAQHLLDEFNNGNWDEVGAYFNEDFEVFFDYLDKYELSGLIDLHYVNSVFENIILLKRLEKNPQECLKYICDNIITDVHPMKGGYYLYLKDRTELSTLFKSDDSKSAVNGVLGEDHWEPFWDTTDNVYGDVIEDLNNKNISILAEYIIKNIGGQEFTLDDDYDDPLFQQFSEEQGTEGFFKITNENVMELILDESAMKEMLKKDLSDLKSDLYSIHNNAYNTAYTDKIYNDVWSELETFFITNSWETETKQTASGKQVYYEFLKINDFEYYIEKFLSENKYPEWSDARLTYYGQYCGLLINMMEDGSIERLSFRVPDYPDWTLTKKYVNEIFRDYI